MKGPSARVTRGAAPTPLAAPSIPRAPTTVEQLRFRERDGRPSAYTRLYAQGVDQLVHKDQVYQQFGLHKSPPAPSLQATKTKSASSAKALRASCHIARSNSIGTTQGSSTQRHLGSSVTKRQLLSRSNSATQFAATRSTTPRSTTPRQGLSGNCLATKAGTRLVGQSSQDRKPHAQSQASVRTSSKPQRRQSVIATQLLNKTLKIGPAPIHSSSSAAILSQSESSRMTRQGVTSAPSASTLHRRPSNATLSPPSSLHQNVQGAQLNRRQSLHISAVSHSLTAPQSMLSAGKLPLKDSPTRPLDAQPPPAPVLVPVSRRTSSPIVAPNVVDFGMRRRPSVSPIRAGNQPGFDGSAVLGREDSSAFGISHRPSVALSRRDSKMDRLVEQITVLKNSLGLSDEDLQWKVESTKGNAYEAADRHLNEAEELYDRLLYEIQMLSETPCDEVSAVLVKRLKELVKQNNIVADLRPMLASCLTDVTRMKKELLDARIACELHLAKNGGAVSSDSAPDEGMASAQKRLEDANQRVIQTQNHLKDEMSKLNELLLNLGSETEKLVAACARFKFLSPEAADVSTTFLNILRCIPECAGEKLVALCEQGVQTAQRFAGSKASELKRKEAEMNKAMRDIEIWKARKEQSKEFAVEMARREREWKEAQREANLASLRLLRALVPEDIQQITVDQLIDRAREVGGVLYTYDLALYIKQNRLIHWIVTHESDIARDNFLAVECASFFLNFTSYDINELRAVCEILPDSFDFDKEGKKLDWKRQFMDHVRMLVKQQRGETVKAGWDPNKGTRAEITLKPLTEKQVLNVVYRYPTEEEIQARVDKFELQLKRLKQKKEKREKLVSDDIPTAKSEYLAIADDARSEELQQVFGKATLIKLRDDAKQAYQALCKTRDLLKSEIEHSERQWSTQTPTYEQFLAEVEKIRALDPETRAARIRGPFPSEIDIKPRARAAFKKLSVEEEAEARKQELNKAIADRDRGLTNDNALPIAITVSTSGTTRNESAHDFPSQLPTQDSMGGENSPATAGTDIKSLNSSNGPPKDPIATPLSADIDSAAFRRVKSLRVSTEVLRFLQNDFCSPRRTKSNTTLSAAEIFGPIKQFSSTNREQSQQRQAPHAPKVGVEGGTSDRVVGHQNKVSATRASVTLSEPPKPKSKALLALLQKRDNGQVPEATTDVSAARAPMKLGFLGELKDRALKKEDTRSSVDVLSTESSKQNERSPPSFLSELKSRVGKAMPSSISGKTGLPDRLQEDNGTPKPSFLDELRLKAKEKGAAADIALLSSASTQQVPDTPVEAAFGSPQRSFLDELKAKAHAKLSPPSG